MPPPAGQPFGKYELLERIAAGGMAEIYRAHFHAAAGITKAVVIKKILPNYAGNSAFIQMFMDEAKIVVGLSHGNIAQVFDFGEIDGEYYLAMELVHGQALSKVIRRAKDRQLPVIPTPFAVFLAMEMSKGLHYAHTRLDERGRPLGIVHRDVSPQNVIVAYDGQVKLVDFGIAKARTAGRNETAAGALKGKYVYFAPEQARGKELDQRTDVFATGALLYEMICGRLPFEGKMMDVLTRIARCDFPRPRRLNPEITPTLERILLTAMAEQKADRYQSSQEFSEALAGYLYANAPTFSGASLAHLLAYLYEPELVAEGRPVQLPPAFLEQVPLWRMPLPPQDGAAAPRAASLPGGPRQRTGSRPVPEAVADPGLLHGRARWLLVLSPLAAALLAALIVLLVGSLGTFSIQLTSDPSGATVRINGEQVPGATPLLASRLRTHHPHQVEVSAPGMEPWSATVAPLRGATVPLHAKLEPRAQPASPPPPPHRVLWPLERLVVSARHHAFAVAPSRAARVRLDPRETYQVWSEASSGPKLVYFLEGPDALPADDSFGHLPTSREQARTLRHASALYAFALTEHPPGGAAAVRVRVQPRGSGEATTLLVDASLNGVFPTSAQRVTLEGLDPSATYQLKVRAGPAPLQLRQGSSGRASRVLLLHPLEGRVLQLGEDYPLTGAAQVHFTFPDDSALDNEGALVVEVSAAGVATGSGL